MPGAGLTGSARRAPDPADATEHPAATSDGCERAEDAVHEC